MSVTTALPHQPEVLRAGSRPARIRDRAASRILLGGLALGAAADALFYGKPLGVSALLFVALGLGVLALLARWADVAPVRRNLWLVAPLLFFAAMIGVRANAFLTLLNVGACLGLLTLVAYFYAAGRAGHLSLMGYPIVLFWTALNALGRAAPLIPAGVDLRAVRRRGLPWLLPLLRGLLLALPVLLVFSCLLASADLVFAGYLGRLIQVDLLAGLPDLAGQVCFVGGVAWLGAGGLVYALHRRPAAPDEAQLEDTLANLQRPFALGFVESTTLLVLVDALFLAFGWIQFLYLFGGQANIGVDGFTYAEYARRGFFELVAVAVLTLGLILGLQVLTPRARRRNVILFNGLSTGLVGLVLVLLAAALQRMLLYEAAYGYTELRLYVHAFMVWLAIAFVWFVLTLWTRPARFAVGAFLAALGFLATLNVVNPDATIARQNLARYQASGQIDSSYLAGLSDDAVPTLVAGLPTLPADQRAVLRARLRARRDELRADPAWRAWPAFHLARDAAYEQLMQLP